MIYYKDLENLLLTDERCNTATDIVIVSGFVGWEPLEILIKKFPTIKITLVYGMYAQYKVSSLLHNALLEINNTYDNVAILYSLVPIHSKIYFWNHNQNKLGGYIGSANFSASGLSIDYKEVLEDIETESYETWEIYYKFIIENCIPITSSQIQTLVVKREKNLALGFEELITKNICRATLLIKKDGKLITPTGSGINWGHQNGHPSKTKSEAYITIKAEYRKHFPSMFPEKQFLNQTGESHSGKKTRHESEFEVIWDDGTKMLCVMEGDAKKAGTIYPKQISTSPSKVELGQYLRKRLKLKEGSFVTKEHLEKYGRTHIDIQLLDDGTYYFDFSNKKR